MKFTLPCIRTCRACLPCLVALIVTARGAASDKLASSPVVIDYFYEAGCTDCDRVRTRVLPDLCERFEGCYLLKRYDVGVESNVVRLIAYQEALGITENESVMMVVDFTRVLNGYASIERELPDRVDEAIAARTEPGWAPPVPLRIPEVSAEESAAERISGFTLAAVLVAGFTDGINPCAISTLVFLVSLLGVFKVKGRRLLLTGAAFCLASFLTYTALGFGLLRALHLFAGFRLIRAVVEAALIAALIVLSFLSFRDAVRYRRSHDPGQVTLQLPPALKRLSHRIMRAGLGSGYLVLGGLLIGAAVTALESACTGQVYLPTLVLVAARGGGDTWHAWRYLLAYNTMFILPLIAAFLLAWLGIGSDTLLAWSRREVVAAKLALGAFFLAMAALIAWM